MQVKFKVWGFIDGMRFEQIFENVAEWKAEKTLIQPRAALDVRGMASVEVAT